VPKAWYGADLLTAVPVTAGTRYWILWDPQGNEQVSASDDVADVQTIYWGSFAGTVEGGASWTNGPFTFTDRRWKARLTCVLPCETPGLAGAGAADLSGCNDGVVLTWDAARFPGAGRGAYHVYRSVVGFADARSRGPVVLDAAGTSWVDQTTIPGTLYWYVLEAESLDNPGCGDGPMVAGSTARVDVGPVEDLADVTPPAAGVGAALRVTVRTATTLGFTWLLAPAPGPGDRYVVLRSDDDPSDGFVEVARPAPQSWTDPAVPPRPERLHVWFYDVRAIDACGNRTAD
jgi:hypothetical protein